MKVRIKQIKKLMIDFLRKRKRIVILAGGGVILALIIIAFIDKQIGLFKASSLDPVAYWKFDEGYGTAVNDSSGNGMTGTLGTGSSAPAWQAKEYCISEKCLRFDGSEDYVQRADNAALDIESELSISLWIKPTTLNGGTYYTLVYKGNSTNEANYYLQLYGDELNFGNYQAGWKGTATTDANIPTNQWTHVAMTYSDASDDIDFYVNGILKSDNEQDHDMVLSGNNQPFYLGSSAAELEFYKGFLDEVRIYSYVRTPDQIKMDFQGGGSHGSSIQIGNADYSFLSQGLITYWKMDEAGVDAEGETLSNSSGTSHDITLYGDNSTGDNGTGMDCTAEGVYGTGCQFDGVDDYVNLNSFNYLDGTSDMTVSAWIKPDFTTTEASNRYIWAVSNFSLRFNPNQDDFTLSINPTGGSLNLNTSGLTWTQNTWHHIAATYNGSQAIIYWDGEAVATGNTSGVLNPSGSAEYLGAFNTTSYKWLGIIDEVRTYERVLTAEEVQSLYNWSPGPVGYWKLDEGSGTTVYDSSGNGNNSSNWSGNTKWVQGKYGSATSHDGSGDRITIPSSTTLDYQPKYTWSAWLNPTAGSYEIFDKAADTNNGWKIGSNGNKYALTIYYTGDDLMCTVPAVNMAVGEWQHIAWTWDGTTSCTGVKFYKNGNVISFESTTTPTGTREIDTGKQILIGGNGYTDYPGLIDDFKIYNYVRTQEQILEDMNAGHPAVGTPVGSAIVQYKFDESYGDTVHDSGPNGYDGDLGESDTVCPTASNDCPTWTNDGKVGKALSFDGDASDDVIELPVGTSLRGKSDFSISAWIKTDDLGGLQQTIFEEPENSSSNSRVKLGIDTDNKFIFSGRASSGSLTTWVDSTTNLSTDTWYHVVAVFDANTDIHKLFVNGIVQENSVTESAIPDTAPNFNPRIGARVELATHGFDGIIDEFALYPFALTAEQVKLLIQGGKSMVLGAQNTGVGGSSPSNSAGREYCVPGDSSSCSGPVLEINMEEKTGSTAYDTSTNGNNATLGTGTGTDVSDPTWKSPADCQLGNCLEFDGNSDADDYIRVSTNASITDIFDGGGTVSLWIKPRSYGESSGGYLFNKGGANAGWYINLQSCDSTHTDLRMIVDVASGQTDGQWRADCSIAINQWNYVVVTYDDDQTSNDPVFYVNGVQVTNNLDSNPTSSYVSDTSVDLTIANYLSPLATFDGFIDTIRFYNYTRTSAQIAWEYNKGAPIAHYKLDECQGTTAYDASGNENNGTITIGAGGETTVGDCDTSSTAWGSGASGKWNGSLSFDGSDDYIDIGSSAAIKPGTGDYSISAWFKTSTDANQVVVSDRTGLVGGEGVSLIQNGTGNNFQYQIESSDGSETDCNIALTINDGEWHHVVLTWDNSAGRLYGYWDVSKTCTTASPSIIGDDISPATSLYIGQLSGGSARMNGQIDDVRVYNYALTPHQVKEVYGGGAVVFK